VSATAGLSGRIHVYLTRPQIDALLGACTDADTMDEETNEDPQRARDAQVHGRAEQALRAALQGTAR
jgi:hypothetical protein